MTTDYAAQAAKVRAAHERQLDQIRGRRELTAQAKETVIARAYIKAREKLQQLQDAATQERRGRRATLEQRLFTPNAADGTDPATRAAAFRDATDRAAKIDDERDATRQFRDAARAGDTLMLKALMSHCHQLGMRTAIGTYLNGKPDDLQTYNELVDLAAEDASPNTRFHHATPYLLPTPTEIGRYQPHQITEIAASEAIPNL